jgi:hypothetical protein
MFFLCLYFGGMDLGVAAVSGVVFFFSSLLFGAIFRDDIYFELASEGRLDYYKNRELVKKFDIKKCRVGYRRKRDLLSRVFFSRDIELIVLEDGSADEFVINCGSIGLNQSMELCEQLEELSLREE